jgi:beta-glucanase (GH16 family)
MKRCIWFAVFCAALLTTTAAFSSKGAPRMQNEALSVREMEKKGWRLTFRDEFNGRKLDQTKWSDSYWYGRTHGNNELQYYAPDGYELKNGILRLKAEKRRYEGHDYTSGMISSHGKFVQKYGYFEIRAKFPKGKGYWPAFWLLPADVRKWPPEIDVLEILGHEPNKVYMTLHWRDEAGRHKQKGGSWVGPDFSADFHVFAIEWKRGEIIWYVDGVERFRVNENVPDEPMYLIANLAVGGDWPGAPDASTVFPGYMDIDYIRVYSRASSP